MVSSSPDTTRGELMTVPEAITFSEFMAARWAPLYRTAYLLTGDRHDAEDLLQAALARTCVRWGSIRDKRAADAYVRQAMVHQMSRQWKRRGREVATDDVPDRGHDGGLDVRADHLALWVEIRKLPPRMRATLVLRYVEDLTEADTARLLGCSTGSVKSQTHHALKRLRAALPDVELQEMS
jgi:RNA polymerase sigma-70 factor (sigma-E family)